MTLEQEQETLRQRNGLQQEEALGQFNVYLARIFLHCKEISADQAMTFYIDIGASATLDKRHPELTI